MRTTAKFGSFINNESIIDRFKTQITQNFNRSQIQVDNNRSHMNLSQLQLPGKEDIPFINTQNQIRGQFENDKTIYRCPICDRLRAVCPYKGYKTYQSCQKCTVHQESNKHQRTRILSNNTPSFSKQLNSTLAETRGHSISRAVNNSLRLDGSIRNLKEVNKLRFVQSNNVYPLRSTRNQFQNLSEYVTETNKEKKRVRFDNNILERPRAITQNVIIRPSTQSYHHVINHQPIIAAPPNIEEIIFYPVIHNKVVYKSAQKSRNKDEELVLTGQSKRSRYQSNYSGKKSRKIVDKVVSDFLQTTKPDEILTPYQFKKLADSIYRQNNPNLDQE